MGDLLRRLGVLSGLLREPLSLFHPLVHLQDVLPQQADLSLQLHQMTRGVTELQLRLGRLRLDLTNRRKNFSNSQHADFSQNTQHLMQITVL